MKTYDDLNEKQKLVYDEMTLSSTEREFIAPEKQAEALAKKKQKYLVNVSDHDGVTVYNAGKKPNNASVKVGGQRHPITLYKEQWILLNQHMSEVMTFVATLPDIPREK